MPLFSTDSTNVALTPCGPCAWLLQHEDHSLLTELSEAILENPPPSFIEPVLGYDTLLFHFSSPIPEETLRSHIRSLTVGSHSRQERSRHIISVRYNSPDLQEIADDLKLSREEIIQLHCAPTYTVRFLGFSPGFAYLDGLDTQLHLPRRSSPRTRIEPGSVAIGGSHAGIYTIPSPGGWNILGHTDHPLFSPEKNDLTAFTLKPGDTLKFQSVD
ncbi:allophanate hydrolase [Oceaniferula spumae]|uniref:Allophanate hydrolase n=1 Tax=Oceaniferula spumae TaxID=2979115 RepID=A0AAT9FJW7_9BACT